MSSRPLSQWLALVTTATILVAGMASFGFLDLLLSPIATAQINARARGLMETMVAVRQYTESDVTPVIEPVNLAATDDFLPASVPSYAAKSVFSYMKTRPQYRDYVYREAVLNPTNVEDVPDQVEAAIVERFKEDPSLNEVSGKNVSTIFSYHYTARPLKVTSVSCLRCHSTPDKAPAGLVKKYGSDKGYGWKVGEVIGAQIVNVPLNVITAEKENLKGSLVALIVAVLIALAVLILLALDHLLVRPLTRLSRMAEFASQSPEQITFPQAGGVQELNHLQRNLERLRVSLLVAMNMAKRS